MKKIVHIHRYDDGSGGCLLYLIGFALILVVGIYLLSIVYVLFFAILWILFVRYYLFNLLDHKIKRKYNLEKSTNFYIILSLFILVVLVIISCIEGTYLNDFIVNLDNKFILLKNKMPDNFFAEGFCGQLFFLLLAFIYSCLFYGIYLVFLYANILYNIRKKSNN